MSPISNDPQSPARIRWLRRFLQTLNVSIQAEDPRRRKRFAGYRIALDDKSIALYGYDKGQVSRISASLNLY